jgi:hypothetical protein
MADPAQKQKVIIGVVVVIVLIVAWQVFGLIGGGSSSAPPTPPPPVTTAAKPLTPAPAGAAAPTIAAPAAPAGPAAPKPSVLNLSEELLSMQRENEVNYIKQLNELQMLKLQKQIADLKQSLKATELATMTEDQNIAELITAKVGEQKPVEGGDNAKSTVASALPQFVPIPPPPPPPAPEAQYDVVSVSYKAGKWRAVMVNEKDNKKAMYDVAVGDTLSPDDSKVYSINKSGVILIDKTGKKRKVSYLPSVM